METTKVKKTDFTKHPYRGVYAEIAKELDVSPQSVRQAVVLHRNPRIMTLVANKIKERKHASKLLDRALAG